MDPTERRPWTRDELIIAFKFYCENPFGQFHTRNPKLVNLAEILKRTPSSLGMKLCNLASLDPTHQARGVKGLGNASRLDKEVWDEFHQDWTHGAVVAEATYQRARQDAAPSWGDQPTTTRRVVEVRIAQQFFRRSVAAAYQYKCAICGLEGLPRLLVASHIIPWKSDVTRRADPRNGLLLCAIHDRAFDTGLIGLNDKLEVMLSLKLGAGKPQKRVEQDFTIFGGQPIHLPHRFAPDPDAVAYHGQHIYQLL